MCVEAQSRIMFAILLYYWTKYTLDWDTTLFIDNNQHPHFHWINTAPTRQYLKPSQCFMTTCKDCAPASIVQRRCRLVALCSPCSPVLWQVIEHVAKFLITGYARSTLHTRLRLWLERHVDLELCKPTNQEEHLQNRNAAISEQECITEHIPSLRWVIVTKI